MRVKRSLAGRRRHKRVLKAAKGFGQVQRRLKTARQAVMRAGRSAYIGRKLKKRQFRAIWIVRLNAAVRAEGMNYSTFIYKLREAKILVNRKMLADLAYTDPEAFKAVLKMVKKA